MNDPETVASIYRRLGEMGDNGGFDPEVIDAMKRKHPEYVTHIDVFIRTLTVNRLAGLIVDMRAFDARLCAVEGATQKTLQYVVRLVQDFTDERGVVIAHQSEHEAREAKRRARRDRLMVASVPVMVALIEVASRL